MLLLFLASISGCTKQPRFKLEPEIELKSIERFVILDDFQRVENDSISITITFKDGDGDLGASDQGNVFDCESSLQDYNFIAETYKLVDGEWEGIVDDSIETGILTFGDLFPDLGNGNGPLQGEMSYAVLLPHLTNENGAKIKTGDTLQFSVFIVDNACRRSNVIWTPSVVFREEDIEQ